MTIEDKNYKKTTVEIPQRRENGKKQGDRSHTTSLVFLFFLYRVEY